jgi:hypothetical protein
MPATFSETFLLRSLGLTLMLDRSYKLHGAPRPVSTQSDVVRKPRPYDVRRRHSDQADTPFASPVASRRASSAGDDAARLKRKSTEYANPSRGWFKRKKTSAKPSRSYSMSVDTSGGSNFSLRRIFSTHSPYSSHAMPPRPRSMSPSGRLPSSPSPMSRHVTPGFLPTHRERSLSGLWF